MDDRRPEFVAERVRQERVLARITQQQLADALGVDVSTVCKWESGGRPIAKGTQERIARAFGITLDRLFGNFPAANGSRVRA